MGLREYKKKRDFKVTAEPAGKATVARSKKTLRKKGVMRFGVQKHAASRLHFDFRLELDGVLKSWAVPKGPSMTPGEKRLAVHVEDHPVEYLEFEGTIPKGQYGGGTVMLWDIGTWEPAGDEDASEAYRSGHMKFVLHGKKLRGSWALVRMKGRAGEDADNWLLIRHADDDEHPGLPTGEERSVKSERTMEEIAAGVRGAKVWRSNRVRKAAPAKPRARRATMKKAPARRKAAISDASELENAVRASMPEFIHPQLATLVEEPPAGEDWLIEMKFDGYRIVARKERGRVRLITRNGHDWTHRMKRIAAAVEGVPGDNVILDGEVVALKPDGTSDFQALQNSMKGEEAAPLAYYVFDVPYLAGYDLRRTPLEMRKQALGSLVDVSGAGLVRYSHHVRGHAPELFKEACRRDAEGLICKDARSPYVSRRARSWLKLKCGKRQEFVVGGFTAPAGSRERFGALALGYYDSAGRLVYAGRVGAGFSVASLNELANKLDELRMKTKPFEVVSVPSEVRGVMWVSPRMVVEVGFSMWTREGLLRHPVFMGLREDKRARDVKREEAEATPREAKR